MRNVLSARDRLPKVVDDIVIVQTRQRAVYATGAELSRSLRIPGLQPLMYPRVHKETRRASQRRFPYAPTMEETSYW